MKIRFAEYVLDSDSRQLLHQGKEVSLSPKAFQLLTTLLENQPKALSKTALIQLLWPDAIVGEANLSNLVGEIRAALGDDPKKPRFIRTVHRFGYAFRGQPTAAASPTERAGGLVRVKWPGGAAQLGEGEHVVGRDSDLDVCLASASVSRRHALIHVRSGQATLEDLGSKNGTAVNGQRITKPHPLADGDEVVVGSVRLKIRLLPPAGTTETAVSRSGHD